MADNIKSILLYDGKNYSIWKPAMLRLLTVTRLKHLVSITPTITLPEDATEEQKAAHQARLDQDQIDQCNAMLIIQKNLDKEHAYLTSELELTVQEFFVRLDKEHESTAIENRIRLTQQFSNWKYDVKKEPGENINGLRYLFHQLNGR
jgi:hypothetical protein